MSSVMENMGLCAVCTMLACMPILESHAKTKNRIMLSCGWDDNFAFRENRHWVLVIRSSWHFAPAGWLANRMFFQRVKG